jgi:dCMP deaminase
MRTRESKKARYLRIAGEVARGSTCLRRQYGAIIVREDEIIATGYNGAPRGRKNCNELNFCMREKLQIPRGERYELCRAVHAEANAIIAAPRDQMLGATLYQSCVSPEDGSIVGNICSCMMCKRLITNAGITTAIFRDTEDEYRVIDVQEWIDNDDSLSGLLGY